MQLQFKTKELLYDIANYSYIEGDIMSSDNARAKHHTQDICADGNKYRIYRVLQLAHAEIIELLYPFTKVSADANKIYSSDLVSPDVFTIDLTVPSTFSDTSCIMLREAIHEYLVCRVVADWMSIVNPAKHETWLRKVEAARENIKGTRGRRLGTLRRGMTWGPSSGIGRVQTTTTTTPSTPSTPVVYKTCYTGVVTEVEDLTPEVVANGAQDKISSRAYSAKLPRFEMKRFFYAYPKSFGELTSAMNGIYESISAFDVKEVEITNSDGAQTYYVYYNRLKLAIRNDVTIDFK